MRAGISKRSVQFSKGLAENLTKSLYYRGNGIAKAGPTRELLAKTLSKEMAILPGGRAPNDTD